MCLAEWKKRTMSSQFSLLEFCQNDCETVGSQYQLPIIAYHTIDSALCTHKCMWAVVKTEKHRSLCRVLLPECKGRSATVRFSTCLQINHAIRLLRTRLRNDSFAVSDTCANEQRLLHGKLSERHCDTHSILVCADTIRIAKHNHINQCLSMRFHSESHVFHHCVKRTCRIRVANAISVLV